MVVTRSSSKNSKRLRSADVSDPSLYGSKRSRVVPSRPKAKPKKERKYTDKDRRRDEVRAYATDAINIYNERAGTKYELVKPGYISHHVLSLCFLHHMDFTAKKTDVAGAPVEIFFAELTSRNGVRCVKFCTSMGPKNLISGDKNNGCYYCSYNVQHPRGGGFLRGRIA
ncbi:hypothetical protein MKW94_019980 [Papaver nudicaule]|uniref:DUF3615 domain-containing protein n=1 Tax=Papaver nudicaule TaxID=74823 RepID=A0AA41S9N1_PAPNU|nr:hypothetical protein [Papaver nudicaule]